MASKYLFYTEDKYDVVIEALEELGWQRSFSQEQATVVWTNLKSQSAKRTSLSTDFGGNDSDSNAGREPGDVLVNHFIGSQHFSNKAYLIYHILTHPPPLSHPPTWSPCVHGASTLLLLLLKYELQNLLHSGAALTETSGEQCESSVHADGHNSSYRRVFNRCKNIYDILKKSRKDRHRPIDRESQVHPIVQEAEIERLLLACEHFYPSSISPPVWIVKPVGSSCGEGIKVVWGIKSVLETILPDKNKDRKQSPVVRYVVQKYIERPLLLHRRKFDIRQWVLITQLSPLTVYGFSEPYIRLASQPYASSSGSRGDEFGNPLVHLTNHSIQKSALSSELTATTSTSTDDRGLHDDEDCLLKDQGYMMRLEDFRAYLNTCFPPTKGDDPSSCDIYATDILPQIQQVVVAGIYSVRDQLQPSPNAFEWLGVDLMIEEEKEGLRVRLIEINTSPDISPSTGVTAPLVRAAARDVWRVVGRTFAGVWREVFAGAAAEDSGALCWRLWHSEQKENHHDSRGSSRIISHPPWRKAQGLRKDYVVDDVELLDTTLALLRKAEDGELGDGKIVVEDDDEL
eukprot:gene28893-34867_t